MSETQLGCAFRARLLTTFLRVHPKPGGFPHQGSATRPDKPPAHINPCHFTTAVSDSLTARCEPKTPSSRLKEALPNQPTLPVGHVLPLGSIALAHRRGGHEVERSRHKCS